MTTKEDVELLRRFARRHWSPTGGVVGGMVADLINSRQAAGRATVAELLHAVVRLYSSNPNTAAHKVLFAKDDIESLRNALEDVPMTVAQRKRVGDRLGKLEGSPPIIKHTTCACGLTYTGDRCACDRERERHAEQAIESITEEIGIHDYGNAARAVLATWSAMVKIREAHVAGSKQDHALVSTASLAVVAQAIQDHSVAKRLRSIFHTTDTPEGNSMLVQCAQDAHRDSAVSAAGGYLLGIMAKWRAWDDGELASVAQQRVLNILKAIRMPTATGDFQSALTETIDVLDYMLGEIPF